MNKPPTLPPPVVPAFATKPGYVRVRCNQPDALHKFMLDLKEARDCCKDSAGCYSAFLVLADGRKLQIEIAFPGRIP
jgi:hypothetical protein